MSSSSGLSVQVSKKIIIAIAGILAVAIISWLVFAAGGEPEQGMSELSGQAPPEVTVITIEKSSLDVKEKLPGRTSAYRIAQIRPQVSGIVVKRLFQEGAQVKQGEQLYQLDPASYSAELESATANLRSAKANAEAAQRRMNRFNELIETRAISQQDFDDAKTALEQAQAVEAQQQAAVKTAELNLAYTRVYAPISGRIGRSQVTEGALVTANQTEAMSVITQLDPIYVDVTQSTTDNMQLRSTVATQDKLKVDIDPTSIPGGYEHQGELQFSDVLVDESTGSVQLRALFPNPDNRLLPGMFVNAILHLGQQEVILVPQQAVSRTPDGQAFVWKIAPDRSVERTPVQTARAIGNQWLISAGLAVGDSIVLEGFQRIMPGATVNPVPPVDRSTGE